MIEVSPRLVKKLRPTRIVESRFMTQLEDLLLPSPQRLTTTDDSFRLGRRLLLTAPTEALLPELVRDRLTKACGAHRCELGRSTDLAGELSAQLDQQMSPESYRLRIDPRGFSLRAGDAAGLFYGLTTLCQ